MCPAGRCACCSKVVRRGLDPSAPFFAFFGSSFFAFLPCLLPPLDGGGRGFFGSSDDVSEMRSYYDKK